MANTTFAAVMTGKGAGAISTVQICGDNAESVLKTVFKPVSAKSLRLETGQILLGTINDENQKIDQVTIGCEGQSLFAIHCHGNPLIVEMIVQLLEKQGVQIITSEQFQARILAEHHQISSIAIEAQIAQAKALTLEGTKIILNQVESGLSKIVHEWLDKIDTLPLESIKQQAEEILQNSSIAKLIISGCKTVLTGPPNTGKSTLLNCLSGRQKAIVTDISGTTRDWITARCQIDSLALELIDTAGLDENLSSVNESIDNISQKKTIELLNHADLILLVLDSSKDMEFDYRIFEQLKNRKIITVLNKSDLTQIFDINRLPSFLSNIVSISAQNQIGIADLSLSIRKTLRITDFDLHNPVCFTERQVKLINQMINAESKEDAVPLMKNLLIRK